MFSRLLGLAHLNKFRKVVYRVSFIIYEYRFRKFICERFLELKWVQASKKTFSHSTNNITEFAHVTHVAYDEAVRYLAQFVNKMMATDNFWDHEKTSKLIEEIENNSIYWDTTDHYYYRRNVRVWSVTTLHWC